MLQGETDDEVVNDETNSSASEAISDASRVIEELKAEIAEIRRAGASDRSKSDATIGELRAQIETLNEYIDGIKKQFEKARMRPKQSLVPPPPPPNPQETSDATTRINENQEVSPKRKVRWW